MRNLTYIGTYNGKLFYGADPDFPTGTLSLAKGTHLTLDDSIWESVYPKVVEAPVRTLPAISIVPAAGNPYFVSVLKEPDAYYGWYSAMGSDHVFFNGLSKSVDGVNWNFIGKLTGTGVYAPINDNGIYRVMVQNPNGVFPKWPGNLWSSSDKINWVAYAGNPAVPNLYGESWILFRNQVGYGLLHRWNEDVAWTDKEGVYHHPAFIRCFAVTQSSTPYSFPASKEIFRPDNQDSGQTEFYTVSNVVYRGGLYIAFLDIYRDDVIVSGAPTGVNGTGYSTVMWSKDGVNWQRYRGQYLSPSANSADFDHAITWISSIVSNGDEDWLYYAGYQWGHVTPLRDDRHLGLLKVKKNRFLGVSGTVKTKLMNFDASALTLNLNGTVIIRVLDESNNPVLPDYQVTGNGVNIAVPYNLANFVDRAIKFQFTITGKLFGFDLQ